MGIQLVQTSEKGQEAEGEERKEGGRSSRRAATFASTAAREATNEQESTGCRRRLMDRKKGVGAEAKKRQEEHKNTDAQTEEMEKKYSRK